MSASPVVPAPVAATKVSWLKKFGQDIEKVVGIIAKDAQPVAAAAGLAIEAVDPALAPLVTVGENLVSKIAQQAQITEAVFASVGQASNGPAKLQAVLNAVGPEVQAWVTSAFPGAAALSTANLTQLVNAVVAILNSVDGNLALTPPTTTAIAAASAAVAAVTASYGAPATK
jgi:hypothetical protein